MLEHGGASFIPQIDHHLTSPDDPCWALQRFSFDIDSGSDAQDPFDADASHITDSQQRVLRRLATSVEQVFQHQHRTAHYMVFVCRSKFRVMRWDRSGVIVSEPTEYASSTRDTKKLLHLLYALSKMTSCEAGLDPTTIRLSPRSLGWAQMKQVAFSSPFDKDVTEFTKVDAFSDKYLRHDFQRPERDAPTSFLIASGVLDKDPTVDGAVIPPTYSSSPTFKYIRRLFAASLIGGTGYAITIDGRLYLIGSPAYAAEGLIGRGGRGYVALEWHSQRFVWLKDCWRPHYTGRLGAEGETLRILNAADVERVPTLVCYEDVPGEGQVTVTSEYSPQSCIVPEILEARPSANPSTSDSSAGNLGWGLRRLTHSRLVVAEVCLPPSTPKYRDHNGRHLLEIIDDVIQGAF